MALRVLDPDSGQIRILGQPLTQDSLNAIGYLPEERGIYRQMRVRKLLQFFAELKGRLLGGTNGDHAANTNGERRDLVLETETNRVPPGGLTNSTPGQSDRMQRALARAGAKTSTVGDAEGEVMA